MKAKSYQTKKHPVRLWARRTKRDRWGSPQKRKERFLMHLFFMATARDMQNDSQEAQRILNFASRIDPKQIPPMPLNAARIFMRFVQDEPRCTEWNWMRALEAL